MDLTYKVLHIEDYAEMPEKYKIQDSPYFYPGG